MRPPPAHRATTAHLQAVYPFVSDGTMGQVGPLVGRDLMGGPFRFDPWDLYTAGRLTNPNVVVLGQLGRGKSSFVKSLIWRQLAFGRRAWVVDPKGEYGSLAEACDTRTVALSPGGSVRLNPLDMPGRAGAEAHPGQSIPSAVISRAELTSSLLSSSLRRPLGPEERAVVDLAVRLVSRRREPPILPDVVMALLEPDPGDAAEVGTDVAGLAAAGRLPALELRRMVHGDLAGMFDGPTSPGVDLAGPVAVLDLSATFSSPALPLIMTCATAWLQAALAVPDGMKRLVVIDEAWAILNDLAIARWTQATFKLSRSLGVSNVVVAHRVSDLRAAGADGSAEEKLASGLLADSETRVVFGQSQSEAEATGRQLGLGAAEVEVITRLPRGVALWQVGGRSFLVEHLLGPGERTLVDTDQAMRP
jgi:hypothetical protein